MNILVIHGPNTNLLGVHSARTGDRITLGRIDTALKRKASELEVTLKTVQTHDSGKAITFIQRNKNWADGILFSPGPWSKCHHDILHTLTLVSLPVAEVHFSSDFEPDDYAESSVFASVAVVMKKDLPVEAYVSGLVDLDSHLKSRE